jgi:Bax protein
MVSKKTIFGVVALIAVIFSAIFVDKNSLPDFSNYTEVRQKKSAFFEYILPLVKTHNQRVLVEREVLEGFSSKGADLDFFERIKLNKIAENYFVDRENRDDKEVVEQLLLQVDAVPPSLALAQAAIESAWGTSRFAVEGNNLFGQWCYKKGCGMVPRRRGSGSHHEVAEFSTVSESVESYTRNINTHRAYSDLRASRANIRSAGGIASGHILAENLLEYSELREKYVHEVQAVIRINKLAQYDQY